MKIFIRGMVCACLAAIIVTSHYSLADDSNVLINGSFENAAPGKIKPKDSIDGWNLVNGKAAKGHFYIVESLDNPQEHALKIKVRNPGFKPWSIRAVQKHIYVEPGVEYQFKAKVAGPKGTRVAMIVQTPEIKRIAGQRIDLDDQQGYQEVSFNFTPEYNEETGFDGSEIRLAIRAGFKRNRHRSIILDDISITRVEPPYDCNSNIGLDYPEGNLVRNGNFNIAECFVTSDGRGDNPANDWFTQTLVEDASAFFTVVEDPIDNGGNVMEVMVGPAEDNTGLIADETPWYIQMVQWSVPVEAGGTYRFHARVHGSPGSRMNVLVQAPDPTYTTFGFAGITFEENDNYVDVEFDFVPTADDVNNGSLVQLAFHMGMETNAGATFFIDDVSILPIAPPPPPASSIVNGDFETGELYVISQGQDNQIALPWIVNAAEPGVLYQLVDGPFNSGGQSMLVQILSESLNPAIVDAEANGNSSPWFIQMFQQNIAVVPGNDYELRARVYGQPGTMIAALAQAGDPTYSNYGQAYFEFPEGLEQFVDVAVPFTPFDDGSNNGYHANIAFHFGFSQNFDKYFYIDDVDVVLVSDNCDPAIMNCNPGGGDGGELGIERVENGNFNIANLGEISNGMDEVEIATAWELTSANNSEVSYSVIENPLNGGDNALQVEVLNVDPASNAWDLQVAQTTVPVVPRVEHLLEFEIDGTAFTQVTVWAQSPAPYYQGFNSMTVMLDDQEGFETFSMNFTPTAIADDYDGSILQLAYHFALEGNSGSTVFLDNVSIRATSDTPPPEEELPPQALSEPALHTLVDFPLGLAVGSAGNSNDIISGSELAERRRNVVTHHFNSVVAENIMKPYAMHPEPDTFNWFEANELVSFTQENNLALHGHTLIWHQQSPGWMETFSGTEDEWIGMMASHIAGMMINFVDDIQSWDVVNEAFNEDGTYRESFWYNGMGESYIELAFNLARNVSSETDLYYNDYNLAANDGKLAGVLAMADDFLARGVPLDGIGLQMHVSATWPSIENIRASFAAVASRGLKVRISELDLNMNGSFDELTPEAEAIQFSRFREIAIAYREMVPAELRGGITIWGTNDADNWIAINGRQNGFTEWPTLFDDALNEKAAFEGFKEGLTVELE